MDSRLRSIADYFLAAKVASAVNPRLIAPKLLPHVFILDIERATGGLALRIRMTGTEFARVFGRTLDGHLLEDFLHGPHGAKVIAGFHECAETQMPLWMRQVVELPGRLPRFVEGVAIYLAPERIYGGLVVGETAQDRLGSRFEKRALA
jgi:hypothetical protein